MVNVEMCLVISANGCFVDDDEQECKTVMTLPI